MIIRTHVDEIVKTDIHHGINSGDNSNMWICIVCRLSWFEFIDKEILHIDAFPLREVESIFMLHISNIQGFAILKDLRTNVYGEDCFVTIEVWPSITGFDRHVCVLTLIWMFTDELLSVGSCAEQSAVQTD